MSEDQDYVKVEVWSSLGLVGCEIRNQILVSSAEWESMSDDEKEEYCRDLAFESFDWGWKEVSEDE